LSGNDKIHNEGYYVASNIMQISYMQIKVDEPPQGILTYIFGILITSNKRILLFSTKIFVLWGWKRNFPKKKVWFF